MNYKVLYRKYRSQNFSEIVGQDYIIEMLKNSIKNKKTAHAYIFTGVRGTGKTSVAKIFAKAINCLDSKTGDACGKCNNCLLFDTSPDIIELDAASNNSVDEIREIISNSRLVPTSLMYKVYIIDEVHMLSTGAFNALLKTLEEPVDHVKFILATTEIQKVPITILSRCQRFDFQKISQDKMEKHLKKISSLEKIDIENKAISEIALMGDGSLRDSLSALDQLSSLKDKVMIEDVENVFGLIPSEKISEIANIIESSNVEKFIEINNNLKVDGIDIGLLTRKLILLFRNKIYESLTNNENIILYKKIILSLLEIQSELKNSYDNYLLFEVTILSSMLKENPTEEKLIPSQPVKISSVKKEIVKTEQIEELVEEAQVEKIKQTSRNDLVEIEEKPIKKVEIDKKTRINNCFAEATKDNKEKTTTFWKNFIDYVKVENLPLYSLLEKSIVEVSSEKYVIISIIDEDSVSLLDGKIKECEKEFNKLSKMNLKICFLTKEDWAEEKEKYKNNHKNGVKYEMKEEIIKVNNSAENYAKELFGENNIDIR